MKLGLAFSAVNVDGAAGHDTLGIRPKGGGLGGVGGGLSLQTSHPALLSPQKVLTVAHFLADKGSDWQPHKRWGFHGKSLFGNNWPARAKLPGEGACRGWGGPLSGTLVIV